MQTQVMVVPIVGSPGGGGGALAMFAYGSVRAMILGLKFHLKAIFLGLKFAKMNFPCSGGKNFQQLPLSFSSIM